MSCTFYKEPNLFDHLKYLIFFIPKPKETNAAIVSGDGILLQLHSTW